MEPKQKEIKYTDIFVKVGAGGFIVSWADAPYQDFIPAKLDEDCLHNFSATSGNAYKLENGIAVKGQDVQGVLDLHTVKAQARKQIDALKARLAAMDYKTSKYADGEYTQGEWAAIVAERKAMRQQIGVLESQI